MAGLPSEGRAQTLGDPDAQRGESAEARHPSDLDGDGAEPSGRAHLRLSIHRDFQRPGADRARLQPHQYLPLGAAHRRRRLPGQRDCAGHHHRAVRAFRAGERELHFAALGHRTADPGAVNPTSHPLVALFSGPPCTAGDQLLVRFHPASSSVSMTTSLMPCSPESANFLVAGMYPSTQYLMHWEEYDGTSLVNTGADLPFTTGALPASYLVHAPTFTGQRPAHRARRGLSSGLVALPDLLGDGDRPRRECDLVFPRPPVHGSDGARRQFLFLRAAGFSMRRLWRNTIWPGTRSWKPTLRY